jgi:hypothetical protein
VFTIVYRSDATRQLSAIDLAKLCLVSAGNNRKSRVTGFLIHYGGVFLQILEGSEADVVRTFGAIACDPRHTNIAVLLHGDEDGQRSFAFWSMNIASLDDADFRSRVLPGPLSPEEVRQRCGSLDFALDVLARAYTETCVQAAVDPPALAPVHTQRPGLVWPPVRDLIFRA